MNILNSLARSLVAISILSFSMTMMAQSEVDLSSQENQISYAVGANVGQGLNAQAILDGLDLELFVAGMLDGISGEIQMSETEVITALQAFQQQMQQEAQNALVQNLAASEAFLAENGARDGVVTLASGLQYEILESGPAEGVSPSVSDSVLAHYHGILSDGSVFDSSVDRGEPATFGLSQVIAGWTEALQLMKTGDKWRLFIPPDLAYGEASPTPAIPPNSALIFDVELLEIR